MPIGFQRQEIDLIIGSEKWQVIGEAGKGWRSLPPFHLRDARLAETVDALLGHLLSLLVPGFTGRPTDGVIFEYSRVQVDGAVGSGIAVMIDQTVEPLRVEFALDGERRRLASGRVCFSDATATVGYGSREHRKLQNAFLADPAVEYPWKVRFRRDGGGWHREAA